MSSAAASVLQARAHAHSPRLDSSVLRVDQETLRALRDLHEDSEELSAEAPRLRVLLAEDDAEMRSFLREELEASGYDVISVGDGKTLMQMLSDVTAGHSDTPPDLIISDIRMPGFTGLEVLGALRKTHWAMPVILITAFGDAATHEEARRLGAAKVIDKPFDIDVLMSAVRELSPAVS